MAASSGTLILIGKQTGQSYARGIYIPDAAADVLRFDAGAGPSATSPDFATWSEDVILRDFVALGAPTATQVRLTLNGTPTSQLLRYNLHLVALAFRPQQNLTIPAGARLGGINVT